MFVEEIAETVDKSVVCGRIFQSGTYGGPRN